MAQPAKVSQSQFMATIVGIHIWHMYMGFVYMLTCMEYTSTNVKEQFVPTFGLHSSPFSLYSRGKIKEG